MGTKLSRKTFLLCLVVCLTVSSIGGVLPDLERLWTTGFTRGTWHQEGYLIGSIIWGVGVVLVCIGVVLTYLRRP